MFALGRAAVRLLLRRLLASLPLAHCLRRQESRATSGAGESRRASERASERAEPSREGARADSRTLAYIQGHRLADLLAGWRALTRLGPAACEPPGARNARVSARCAPKLAPFGPLASAALELTAARPTVGQAKFAIAPGRPTSGSGRRCTLATAASQPASERLVTFRCATAAARRGRRQSARPGALWLVWDLQGRQAGKQADRQTDKQARTHKAPELGESDARARRVGAECERASALGSSCAGRGGDAGSSRCKSCARQSGGGGGSTGATDNCNLERWQLATAPRGRRPDFALRARPACANLCEPPPPPQNCFRASEQTTKTTTTTTTTTTTFHCCGREFAGELRGQRAAVLSLVLRAHTSAAG